MSTFVHLRGEGVKMVKILSHQWLLNAPLSDWKTLMNVQAESQTNRHMEGIADRFL